MIVWIGEGLLPFPSRKREGGEVCNVPEAVTYFSNAAVIANFTSSLTNGTNLSMPNALRLMVVVPEKPILSFLFIG